MSRYDSRRHRGSGIAGIRFDCSMLAEDETVFLLPPDRGRPRSFLSEDRTVILDDLPQRRIAGGDGMPEEAIVKYIGSRVRRRRREAGEEHEGGGVCVVCQDDLVGGNTRIATLDCAHEFHAPCIERWLRRSNTCPLCKATVIPASSQNSELLFFVF